MSTVVTCSEPSRRASSAALNPVPVPISSTSWPSWTSRASRSLAIRPGAVEELVACPTPPPAVTASSTGRSSTWVMRVVSL